MNYQVLDVKVKDTEETAKLYTYFLDNSREIAPERVRPVIVICPGGGYEWVSEREAEPIALKFVGAGYHAVVLHYSVAPAAHYPTALRQLAWTVAHLREHAAEYHIDPNKVVVAGFSAGGHLAASLGVHWRELGLPRPDGMILGYPVITAGKYAHRGSIQNLAGSDDPGWYSLETQVTADTPPAFFWHTVTDPEVPVQNSLLLAGALSAAGVRYEMHLYPRGVHGLSLATPEVDEPEKHRVADPHIAGWFGQCLEWLDILKTTKE